MNYAISQSSRDYERFIIYDLEAAHFADVRGYFEPVVSTYEGKEISETQVRNSFFAYIIGTRRLGEIQQGWTVVRQGVRYRITGIKLRPGELTLTLLLIAPNAIDDLVGWYKADAITGKNDLDVLTEWPDFSSLGFNIPAVGSPVYRTNQINSLPAVSFGGAADYFRLLDDLGINSVAPRTVSVVAINDTTNEMPFWSWGNFNANDFLHYGINLQNFTTSSFGIQLYNSQFESNISSSASYRHHFVSVGDLTVGNELRDNHNMFVDNSALRRNLRAGTGLSVAWNSVDFYIGYARNVTPANIFFDGMIAEVIVWNRKLTGSEKQITQLYITDKYGI